MQQRLAEISGARSKDLFSYGTFTFLDCVLDRGPGVIVKHVHILGLDIKHHLLWTDHLGGKGILVNVRVCNVIVYVVKARLRGVRSCSRACRTFGRMSKMYVSIW